MILVAAASVGLGSSVFHPEASRLARLSSGGRYGFAQSLFQVRGNAGQSLGPLPAAFIILLAGRARSNVIWFTLVLVDWPESLCLQRRPMVPTKSSSSAQAYQARRFWYGWDWIGCSGPTSRSHQHRIRLLDLLVSTSDWSSQRIPS